MKPSVASYVDPAADASGAASRHVPDRCERGVKVKDRAARCRMLPTNDCRS